MLLNYKKKKFYFIGIVLVSLFLINAYQISTQHWSARLDHDFYILYNSLLISSGYEQQGIDHPAFTTFLIHGGIFKLLSFFQEKHSSNIDVILNSKHINDTLQYYFAVARITNYFINISLIFLFYHFLNLLNLKKNIIFFTCIILSFSQWYTLSFFQIRSEILSLVFFTISMIFILSQKRDVILNYFIAGIFLALAMLTKIQIIFFFAFPLLLLPFFCLKNDYLKRPGIKSKVLDNYFIYSFAMGIICYIVFQILIQEYPRFEKNKFLDLFFVLFSSLILLSYYLIFNKFNYDLFKRNVVLLSSILNGFVFLIGFLFFLDFVNLLQINNFIFLRISNPIHYLSEYQYMFAGGAINVHFLVKSFIEIFTSYIFSKLELIVLLLIIFLTIRKNYNKNNHYLKYIGIVFLVFVLNTAVSSFRPAGQYHTYYAYCYLVVIALCVNDFKCKYSKYFMYSVFFLFVYNNFYGNITNHQSSFNTKIALIKICDEFKSNEQSKPTITYLKYWHNKFDDNAIKMLCKSYRKT